MTAGVGPIAHLHDIAVTFSSTTEVRAVDHCDLTVDGGDHVAVVGRSGSGKTTLLNVLGLLIQPTAGTYELDGQPTESLSERERAHRRSELLGFVFQSFNLLRHRTVLDNVAAGLLYRGGQPRTRRTAAADVLERIGLGHRAQFLPRHLSGGEQQRVAIARALVGRPRLLLCDEPTGDLDSHTAGDILDLIDEQVDDGVAVVVITHDAAVAARARRTLTMSDGRLLQ